MPTSEVELDGIHSRLLNHSDKLFVALEDIEAAGGLQALRGVMKPASVARTVNLLKSVHKALSEQLARDRVPAQRVRGPGRGPR